MESWISPGCSYEFNVVYCNETIHCICFTIATYEVHTFKNGNTVFAWKSAYPWKSACLELKFYDAVNLADSAICLLQIVVFYNSSVKKET